MAKKLEVNNVIQDSAMIENIKNYADSIKTIEEFVDAVRQNPGQFIGYLRNKGFINMIREILQNSIDELVKKDSPCTHIKVSYDERNHTVIIEDNGRGLPFGHIIRILTSQNTSSNYIKKEGEFSSGLHGVGSKVTNALSDVFIVDSYILGDARHIEFYDGKPWDKGEVQVPNPGKQGTIIMFHPSYEIMGEITTTCADVLGLIKRLLPLIKIGAVIEFSGILMDGKAIKETMVNEDGIITDLILKTAKPLIKPVVMQLETGTMKADIAFTYDTSDLTSEDINSFSNFCPTIAGTHLDGFMDGLCNFFRNYMNKIYLANNKKLSVINGDIRTSLKAIISVAHLKPVFSGQAKEILDNADMYDFVKDLVNKSLEVWSKDNPQDLQKLCKFFKEICEIRLKSEGEKIKLSNNYKSTSLSQGMPEQFVKPTGSWKDEEWELYIIEGKSARGSLMNSRHKPSQGLFPIRGKMPNAFTTKKSEFLNNAEVSAILRIIYEDYNKNKGNINAVKWKRIVILTDADVDGNHIRSLLLKFFILYCPELIIHGRVFAATPPLYRVVEKGKAPIYFKDRLAYSQYLTTQFSAKCKLEDATTGKKYTDKQITSLLYNNNGYLEKLKSAADINAVNPELMEFVLFRLHLPFDKFKKAIEKEYKFVTVTKEADMIYLDGLVGEGIKTLFINEYFHMIVKEVMTYINKAEEFYVLDGEKVTLYQLMLKFDNFAPATINRYKGLGEMKDTALAESTTKPGIGRNYIRFNIEDLKKEIQLIREMESDRSLLLKDVKVSKEDVMD